MYLAVVNVRINDFVTIYFELHIQHLGTYIIQDFTTQ